MPDATAARRSAHTRTAPAAKHSRTPNAAAASATAQPYSGHGGGGGERDSRAWLGWGGGGGGGVGWGGVGWGGGARRTQELERVGDVAEQIALRVGVDTERVCEQSRAAQRRREQRKAEQSRAAVRAHQCASGETNSRAGLRSVMRRVHARPRW